MCAELLIVFLVKLQLVHGEIKKRPGEFILGDINWEKWSFLGFLHKYIIVYFY